MGTETPVKPRTGRPGSGSGHGDPCHVIVLNDNHNTFEHVAATLARYIPGVDQARGMEFANRIHQAGAGPGLERRSASRPSSTGSSSRAPG